MNPAIEWLRELAESGAIDTYPCPCQAQGRFIELEPGIFHITYEHDDDCPRLHTPTDHKENP